MAGALRELIELLLTEIAISGTDGKSLPPSLLPSFLLLRQITCLPRLYTLTPYLSNPPTSIAFMPFSSLFVLVAGLR